MGRMISFPASASDTTLDIDLAVDALPVQTASGSFPIPPAPHAFHERGDGVVSFFDVDHSDWFLGESGIIAADASNTQFDYQANWIAPPEVTRPLTSFLIVSGRRFVRATVDGYPTAGAQAVSFPDALEVVTPEILDPWRVGDVAVMEGLAAGNELRVNLSNEDESIPLWNVIIPAGRPVRLPPPPPGGVGASTLTGRFLACERGPVELRGFCRRSAQGPSRTVEL